MCYFLCTRSGVPVFNRTVPFSVTCTPYICDAPLYHPQARESREAILRRQANAQQRLESIVQETAPQTFETDFDDDDAGISSAKWTRSQSSKTGRQRSSRKRSSRRRVSAAGKGDGKAGGRTRRGRSRSCSGDSNDSYGSYEGSPSGRVEGGEEDNEESDGSLEYDSDGLSDDSDDDDFDYMDEDHISSTTSYVPCMTLYVLGLMESDQLIFIRVFFVELYNSLLKNVIKNLSHRLKSITNYQDETHGISIKFKLRSSSASSASSSSIAPSPHSSPASPSFGYTHSTVEGLRYVKAVNAVSTMLSDLRRCTSTVQEIKDAQDVQRHHHFYFLPRNLMNQTISDAIRGLINHGNQGTPTQHTLIPLTYAYIHVHPCTHLHTDSCHVHRH